MKFEAIIQDISIKFNIEGEYPNIKLNYNSKLEDVDLKCLTPNTYSLILNGKSYFISINQNSNGYEVNINQNLFFVMIKNEQQLLMDQFGISTSKINETGNIITQMPGLISRIFVSIGSVINKGDKLFILEAMKMENEIISPISGIVKKIYSSEGESVEKGLLVMEIEN